MIAPVSDRVPQVRTRVELTLSDGVTTVYGENVADFRESDEQPVGWMVTDPDGHLIAIGPGLQLEAVAGMLGGDD